LALVMFLAPCEARQTSSTPNLAVPPGTILPVRLDTSLSSNKSKAGDTVRGHLMQDAPLPGGRKIPKGTQILGKVTAVSTAAQGSELSLRFDTLKMHQLVVPAITALRAVAGFMRIEDAHLPTMSAGEGEVYDWLPTIQIGGEDVYGVGGTVTRWNNPSEIVGRETADGLLGQANSREGTDCRGTLYGNTAPQAFWVFSSDACGVYGLAKINLAHAGRSDPLGLIVLRSSNDQLQLPSGTGMLLRLEKSSPD
jgi:hypothetical protein